MANGFLIKWDIYITHRQKQATFCDEKNQVNSFILFCKIGIFGRLFKAKN
jgi:hypothetical protein